MIDTLSNHMNIETQLPGLDCVYKLLIDRSPNGVVVTDANGKILAVNASFTAVTGYSREEAIGQTMKFLKSGRHDGEFYQKMWRQILEEGTWHGDIWNRRKNGGIYAEWLTIVQIKDGQGQVLYHLGYFTDITQQKVYEERLMQRTRTDELTGLLTRTAFRDHIIHSNVHCDHVSRAVLFLDLDRFKEVNDTYGHSLGDRLLQAIATRIQRCIRQTDVVCRLGGDEFVIYLSRIKNVHDAARVARHVIKQLKRPFHLSTYEIEVAPSIGICTFESTRVDLDSIIKNADMAMYRAKASGGGTYRVAPRNMKNEGSVSI